MPSSRSHPSSRQQPQQTTGLSRLSRTSPFITASLSCSSKIRFRSFSCLFFATLEVTTRRLSFSVSLSFTLRFFYRFPAFAIAPILLCACSLSSILCFKEFSPCRVSLNNEAAGRLFFWKKVSRHGLVVIVVPGDTHPIVEVGHDVRYASSWRVLERFF